VARALSPLLAHSRCEPSIGPVRQLSKALRTKIGFRRSLNHPAWIADAACSIACQAIHRRRASMSESQFRIVAPPPAVRPLSRAAFAATGSAASPPATRPLPSDASANAASGPQTDPPTAGAAAPICAGTLRRRDVPPSAQRARFAPSTISLPPAAFPDEVAFALWSPSFSSTKITMMPVSWRYMTSTSGSPLLTPRRF
jgi:hypothetical protein